MSRKIQDIFLFLEGQGVSREISIPFCVRLAGETIEYLLLSLRINPTRGYQMLRRERRVSRKLRKGLKTLGIEL